jgi:predicted transcriptional regulator
VEKSIMSNYRLLTEEQVREAKQLRNSLGYTKMELAKRYEVSPTTIWYNIYGRKRRTKKLFIYKRTHQNYKFTNLKSFVIIVEKMRDEGINSNEIANIFNVPLQEINQIWCKTL